MPSPNASAPSIAAWDTESGDLLYRRDGLCFGIEQAGFVRNGTSYFIRSDDPLQVWGTKTGVDEFRFDRQLTITHVLVNDVAARALIWESATRPLSVRVLPRGEATWKRTIDT